MTDSMITATTPLSMADAEARLRETLAGDGFGVLTEVDVPTVMQQKLGITVDPYRILGVCNPNLAHEAMQIWKGFGLIAPCHVALYDVGDHRVVVAFDPTSVPEVHENAALFDLATRARDAVARAVKSVEA
jgi:uncharacterized protein (DUF302 family)